MIHIEQLTYSYPGRSTPAVREISFAIQAGEIFGFLGPSGAGKSTTQKIIIGLLKGYTGRVQVQGQEVSQWGQSYYEQIGVGFELPNHYLKLTALENLNHFRGLYSRPTEEPLKLLEMVGLKEDAHKKVSEFSKGMKMRLNFVRALIHRPEILFFDEPTSGLDPVNGRVIKDIILRLKAEGRTIFLTTHNMSVADELCDRVGFIVDGQIVASDSPASLKLRYGERQVAVTYGQNGTTSTQQFPMEKLGHNPEFIQLLQRPDIQTIHTQEASLEQIFIQVTGRELA
jgi:fluoroquinolone transport system ATP-binding protein